MEQPKDNNLDLFKFRPILFILEHFKGNITIESFLTYYKPNRDSDYKNKDSQTALHYCCILGKYEFVKILLQNEANLETILEKKDTYNKNALYYAIKSGNKRILNLFIKKNTSNLKVNQFVLYNSIELDKKKFVLDAYFKGANINKPDEYSKTPLILATNRNNVDLIKVFLIQGVLTEVKDKNTQWPAMIFAFNKTNKRAINMLLRFGAKYYIPY